jgi:AraC-like DNA-binding protein
MSPYFDFKNDYDFQVTDIGHIIERRANPNWSIADLTNHSHYILAYAIDGEAVYKVKDNEFTVKKGDVLFFPKGVSRSAYSKPENPWQFYSTSFDLDLRNDSTINLFNSVNNIIRSTNLYRLPSLLAELNSVWTGKRSGYIIKCRSLILDILYTIIKEVDSSNYNSANFKCIDKVLNLLNSNFMYTYSVEDLAKLSNLSYSHFRMLFKKVTGLTTVQYQNNIKIHKSKDLLLNGDCNVTEAALAVGFNDIFYFSRLFKKITGSSPSDYINIG